MDDNAVGLHKRCGPTAFFVIFAKKSGARLFNRHIAQAVGGGGIINLAEKPQNAKQEVKIMRRKKLLRQVAAAAVALSMAVSLSAPAFAAVVTFDLSDGGLVIKANDDGITVERDNGASSTYSIDDEIEITGTYNSTGGAMTTAEENQQEENQPVTPAKAPAKEETSEETQEAEDAPASVKKQEQKDTENLTDPEQKTETENKDNNSDPADEEKKEQNAPANGELNASAGEGQEPKAEDEGQPKLKTEAKASAEATASASDDTSNGPRKAPARSGGEGKRAGIVQIFNNTVDKLVNLTLKDATIDQPHEADTSHRRPAAIDIQGSGGVQITVKGDNLLTGNNGSAAIQKNGDVSTGNLTITAQDTNQKLTVKEGDGDVAIGAYGAGTKNIEINNGTIVVDGIFGSDYGNATGIKITGNAVVNVAGDIRGGSNSSNQDDIEFSGNANVTVNRRPDSYSAVKIGGNENSNVTISGNAQVRGDFVFIDGNLTLKDQAKLAEDVEKGNCIYIKERKFNNQTSDGAVLGVGIDCEDGNSPSSSRYVNENGVWKNVSEKLWGDCNHEKTYLSETIPSTCNTPGKKIYKCFYCGRDAGTEPVACLPHTWVKGETVAPTYTERGYTVYKCQNCDATEQRDWVPMLERESTNGAPNYTVTGAETYETSVADGRYIIAVPSEDAALNAVLGDLRAIKAQGADVVVFRTRSRESSLVIDEMLAMGTDVTPFVLAHNGGEAQLTINGAAHNELIH